MGETKKIDITSESIDALESDLERLKSKEPELTNLVDRLRTADNEIRYKNSEISAIDQIKLPEPGLLDFEEEFIWGSFIDELRRYAGKNEERIRLKGEKDKLTDERNKICGKILEIVPASVRYYKPQIKTSQFAINVSADDVTFP